MPTYDGIGSSITHRVEVVGDSLFQDVDGGTLSTKVPVQIFSNYYASPGSVDSSRQLRFRVQPDGETNVSNSYVTDMGVKGADGSNYFFITAPQNTSNVGDQNTFVISTTSNVGIGTTDPTKTLEVVGDIKCQTLSASTITGASPLVIESDEPIVINAPVNTGTMTVSNIFHSDQLTMSANVFVTEGSTLTLSNIFHTDQLTMSANVVMGSDKTLTTSNIVANSGENLSLNSNLFVDTATGRVGVGITEPSAPLHVYKNDTGSTQLVIENANQSGRTGLGIVNALNEGFNIQHVGGTSNAAIIENFSTVNGGIHFYNKGDGDYIFRTTDNNTERMIISNGGNVGIGVASPTVKLDVNGAVKGTSLTSTGGVAVGGALTGGTTGSFSGNVTFNRGTISDYLVHAGDTNTYMGFSVDDTIVFYTGGGNRMTINSSGNVGIGVSPSTKLHVAGNTFITNSDTWQTTFQLVNSSYSTIGWQFNVGGSANDVIDPGSLGMYNNGYRLVINTLGDVGIGVTKPSYKLHVGGNFYASSDATINGETYCNGWFRVNSNTSNQNRGIYWQHWQGGWFMQDSSYMRVYNDKHIYTGGYLRSGSCYIYSSYQIYTTGWSNIPITSERGTFLVMVQGASNDISCAVFACTDDSGWEGGSVNVLSRQTDYSGGGYFDMRWPGGDTNRNLQIRHTAYIRACYITVLRVA